MATSRLKADLALLLVAIVWGSAFVAQRVAATHLGFFTFNGIRFFLGAALLLPLAGLNWKLDRDRWMMVILAGFFLFSASAFQQAGIRYTTAGNAGFITSLYVVLVPLILFLVWKQRVAWISWSAALLAVVGVMLLSTGGEFRIAPGDSLELVGAFLWASHVIVVSRVVQRINVFQFAAGQYLVAALFNGIFALPFEQDGLAGLVYAWWAILYTAVFSIAFGYTLQAVGQKYAPPSDAALLLSTEAVFAAVFGFLLLDERLSVIQMVGCVLILAAVIISQLLGERTAPAPHPSGT